MSESGRFDSPRAPKGARLWFYMNANGRINRGGGRRDVPASLEGNPIPFLHYRGALAILEMSLDDFAGIRISVKRCANTHGVPGIFDAI